MHRSLLPLRFAFCALPLFILSSCSSPAVLPTSTNIPTNTVVPPTSTPVPAATATLVPAPSRAQYSMNVMMDYAAKSVAVDETIIYPNHTGQSLNDLVLAVEPNLWSGCFTLTGLTLNGASVADYKLDSQKLSFSLPAPLAPETTLTLKIQYTLALPLIEPTNPNLSRPRIFGYSPKQINLTNWYPFIVPNVAGQWVLHDPWYYGEHLVYDATDYTVNVKFADQVVKPIIASSGAPTQNADSTTYMLTSGRAFVLAASTDFQTASTQVGNVIVTSYYFAPYDAAGKAALNATAQALQIYSQRYGPYSHQTLAVVMGDFNDGMEFSGLFYLSAAFYNLYDGTLKNYLVFVAAHETAHQWWFEQVADDQAMQPWLDEALATYSERVFYESIDPTFVPWWWSYRIDYYQPQGFVDIPIYSGGGFRPYTNAVYFRGAHFLEDLRTKIGDDAFFAFLQDYLKQENGKISTSADFFRILRAHTQIDFSDLVKQYFQNTY